MTAKGHLFFSIAFVIFLKKIELIPALVHSDWWHIIPSAVLTCLMPDIDHPKSFLGQRIKWISKPIARFFGHRGFTHSLLAILIPFILFYFYMPKKWIFPEDVLQGMVLGYISHILADMLTPAGVPILWPCRWRFRLPIINQKKGNRMERFFCMVLLICAICMPKNLVRDNVIYLLSQTMHFNYISI